jgi:hypothetical protein
VFSSYYIWKDTIDFDFYEKNYKNLVKTQNDDLKKQKNINLFALFRNKK